MKLPFRLIFVLCFSVVITHAQTNSWQWAKTVTGLYTSGSDVVTDPQNNFFVTGSFDSIAIFDTITLHGNGAFVAKYDSAGHALWAKGTTAPIGGGGERLVLDGNGNLYVTGFYDSTITFGNYVLSNPGNPYPYNNSYFIAKYDTGGLLAWAQTAATDYGNDFGTGITCDKAGNVYVCGSFGSYRFTAGGHTLINADTVAGETHPNGGSSNFFMLKYDPAGPVIWAKSGTGKQVEEAFAATSDAWAITCDTTGNIYLAGEFIDTLVLGNITLSNDGYETSDMFIAKFNSAGTALWAKRAAGTYIDIGYCVKTAPDQHVYLAGYYYSPMLIFGKDTIYNNDPSYSTSDIFLAKLDAAGNVKWLKNAGGSAGDYPSAITVDSASNVYMAGAFTSSPILFGTKTLVNKGLSDIFVAKYDTGGTTLWAESVGGAADESASGICTDSRGNVCITGTFSGSSINFDDSTLVNPYTGHSDFFIARQGLRNVATSLLETSATLSGVTVFPNPGTGNFYFTGLTADCRIEIYGAMGQLVYHSQPDWDNRMVSLTGLAKGLYVYQIITRTGERLPGKIILE